MKKILNVAISILPHIVIILSLMLITFWILNIFNPGMNFLGNDITVTLLMIFFILSLINGIVTIIINRKRDK